MPRLSWGFALLRRSSSKAARGEEWRGENPDVPVSFETFELERTRRKLAPDLVSNQHLQSSPTAALGEEWRGELPDVPVPEVTISRRENCACLTFVLAQSLQPFESDHHKGVSRLLYDRTR